MTLALDLRTLAQMCTLPLSTSERIAVQAKLRAMADVADYEAMALRIAVAQRNAVRRKIDTIEDFGDMSANEPSVDDEIDTSVRGAYLTLVGDA